MGGVGGRRVTSAWIAGLLDSGRLSYSSPPISSTSWISSAAPAPLEFGAAISLGNRESQESSFPLDSAATWNRGSSDPEVQIAARRRVPVWLRYRRVAVSAGREQRAQLSTIVTRGGIILPSGRHGAGKPTSCILAVFRI